MAPVDSAVGRVALEGALESALAQTSAVDEKVSDADFEATPSEPGEVCHKDPGQNAGDVPDKEPPPKRQRRKRGGERKKRAKLKRETQDNEQEEEVPVDDAFGDGGQEAEQLPNSGALAQLCQEELGILGLKGVSETELIALADEGISPQEAFERLIGSQKIARSSKAKGNEANKFPT